MRHSDYHTLINHARKAGVRTLELYSAMASRRPERGDGAAGQADGNGFVLGVDHRGQPVYRPVVSPARS